MRSGNVGCFMMIGLAVIGILLLRDMMTGSSRLVDLHKLNDVVDVLNGP